MGENYCKDENPFPAPVNMAIRTRVFNDRDGSRMPAIHIFIISWRGQHEQAATIATSLHGSADKLTIIYSDPDGEPASLETFSLVRRSDTLYWADKFQACLENCADDEVMLVIHADCRCDDWPRLIARCRSAFEHFAEVGVWAPRITGTPWRLERTRIKRISDSDYSVVAHTDGLVFALNPALYARMRQADYSGNIYGLGIDWLFLCAAYARGMTALIDEAVVVRHPVTRGYSTKQAREQKRAFLKRMTSEELKAYSRLKTHMRPRRHLNTMIHWTMRAFHKFTSGSRV